MLQKLCRSVSITLVQKSLMHTMKLSEEQMKRIWRPGLQELFDIFSKNGYELRLAGGPVRDILMNKTPEDIDLATNSPPDVMKKFLLDDGIRLINMNGEKHGTITPRICDYNFECTTLRVDKSTDGRHADVEFVQDWELDAGRRDLTVNAMFLDQFGIVYDYFNGIEDVENRIVRFVGDPELRIREDYLRILRYCRFYGRISKPPLQYDVSILDVIKKNAHGLSKISKQRLWTELKKVINQKMGGQLLTMMNKCEVTKYLALQDTFNYENVEELYNDMEFHGCNVCDLNPSTVLAFGMETVEDVLEFCSTMLCSNKEKDIMLFITQHHRENPSNINEEFVKHLFVELVYIQKKSRNLAHEVLSEFLKSFSKVQLLEYLNANNMPQLPKIGMLLKDKVKVRTEISALTAKCVEIWIQSNYSKSAEELVENVFTEKEESRA